mmetsp:Transcript_39299/g.44738  ORF Transcript_39299/g.44738 Transcript_39299/m.44738 type:complete len:243 (+) Transcript_39299:963-1691(+)
MLFCYLFACVSYFIVIFLFSLFLFFSSPIVFILPLSSALHLLCVSPIRFVCQKATMNESDERPSWEFLVSRRSHCKYMTRVSDENHPVLYKCNICSTSLTREYSLRLHILSHFKIKRYQCEICHKRYGSRQYLQEHKLIHTQAPWIDCPDKSCCRRFRRVMRLVYHCRSSGHGNPDLILCTYSDSKEKAPKMNKSCNNTQIFKVVYCPMPTDLSTQKVETFDLESFVDQPLRIPDGFMTPIG